MKIGKRIGGPVKVDQATDLILSGKYARVCVEVDVTKPLLAKFKFTEYEGIHQICFHGGVYGHRKDLCPIIYSKAQKLTKARIA